MKMFFRNFCKNSEKRLHWHTLISINKRLLLQMHKKKPGLSTILAQDENIGNAKPVAMVSRSTSKV